MRFLILSALLLAIIPAARAAETKGPFVAVPKTHWGYAAVTSLERSGVSTGYPRGTFAGPRTLTRYEFAVAVQRIAT
ncbi:MAG: S-layer homology domain-containing protein, partial [Actinomycetota bacterium]